MRGYNRAAVIIRRHCRFGKSRTKKHIKPQHFTETQTQKDRISRWQNMQNVFIITISNENKNVLLVDDNSYNWCHT